MARKRNRPQRLADISVRETEIGQNGKRLPLPMKMERIDLFATRPGRKWNGERPGIRKCYGPKAETKAQRRKRRKGK